MFKWIILILVGYVLFRMLSNDKKRKESSKQEEREQLIASGELVKDPVCGTFVEKDQAITVRNGSKIEHFCSYECREKRLREIQAKQEDEGDVVDVLDDDE